MEAKAWQATIRLLLGCAGRMHARPHPTIVGQESAALSRRTTALSPRRPAPSQPAREAGPRRSIWPEPVRRSTHLLNTVYAGAQQHSLSCVALDPDASLPIALTKPAAGSGRKQLQLRSRRVVSCRVVSCPSKRGPPHDGRGGIDPFTRAGGRRHWAGIDPSPLFNFPQASTEACKSSR